MCCMGILGIEVGLDTTKGPPRSFFQTLHTKDVVETHVKFLSQSDKLEKVAG